MSWIFRNLSSGLQLSSCLSLLAALPPCDSWVVHSLQKLFCGSESIVLSRCWCFSVLVVVTEDISEVLFGIRRSSPLCLQLNYFHSAGGLVILSGFATLPVPTNRAANSWQWSEIEMLHVVLTGILILLWTEHGERISNKRRSRIFLKPSEAEFVARVVWATESATSIICLLSSLNWAGCGCSVIIIMTYQHLGVPVQPQEVRTFVWKYNQHLRYCSCPDQIKFSIYIGLRTDSKHEGQNAECVIQSLCGMRDAFYFYGSLWR